MRTLAVLDLKNYDAGWYRFRRTAVRAIIVKDDRILLIKNKDKLFYKFPGGAIEKGETHKSALNREMIEEIGAPIKENSLKAYGMVREIRRSFYKPQEIFDHTSYYYSAELKNDAFFDSVSSLTAESGFEVVLIPIKTAFDKNNALSDKERYAFLQREAFILKSLLK